MDPRIGIGIIAGLTIYSSLYIYKSDKFNETQKIFLLVCIVFPPLQWLLTLILLGVKNNELDEVQLRDTALDNLKNKGLVSEEEYVEKIKILYRNKAFEKIKNTVDHKQLIQLKKVGILNEQEYQHKLNVIINNKAKILRQIDTPISHIDIIGTWSINNVVYKFMKDYNFSKVKNGVLLNGAWSYNKEKEMVKVFLPNQEVSLGKVRIVDEELCFKFGGNNLTLVRVDKGSAQVGKGK